MSKSLDYINYQITTLEDSLQHYTMVEPDKIKEAYIKHDLECLYQIKTELEAWEVVKKYLSIEKSTYEEDWEEIEYNYINFTGGMSNNIDPFHGSNCEEVETLEKALEVQDNG